MFYDRFTNHARKVMAYGHQEAQRLNHDYIGTEHILLGLIKEGSGVAAKVLHNLGADIEKIRLEIEKTVQSDSGMIAKGQIPFTPRAKKVIEHSLEEARTLGHNYIGTEHILLGLIRENDGVAAHVLMNQGVMIEDARQAVLDLLNADTQAQSERYSEQKPANGELASAPRGTRRSKGLHYSRAADLFLIIGQALAGLGAVVSVVSCALALMNEKWVEALLYGPVAFFFLAALYVIFARASDRTS